MGKTSRSSSKYSLVFATLIAFSCVCTAGVSTFAWFQANAAVTIQAEPSSTTITVENPSEDFTMSVYQYNGGNPYKPSEIGASVSFTSTFANTGDSAIPTKTLWPGYAITFCLVSTAVEKQHSLSIDSMPADSTFYSRSPDIRYLYNNGSTTTSIDIRWASLVFGKGFAYASGSYPTETEVADFLKNSANDAADCHYKYLRGGSETYDTLASANPGGTSKLMYLFFTVYFSDDPSTCFQHVSSAGVRQYNSPDFESGDYSGTTYWKPNTSGAEEIGYNSEAYTGLQFKIGSLKVS